MNFSRKYFYGENNSITTSFLRITITKSIVTNNAVQTAIKTRWKLTQAREMSRAALVWQKRVGWIRLCICEIM